jgi:hypothetical protein
MFASSLYFRFKYKSIHKECQNTSEYSKEFY